jgi:hypothetical protein
VTLPTPSLVPSTASNLVLAHALAYPEVVLRKPTLLSRKKIDAHGLQGGAPAQIPSLAPALVPAFGLASCPVGAAAALGPPMGSVLGYLESGVVDGLCSVREEDIV